MGAFVGGFVAETDDAGAPGIVGPILQAYVEDRAGDVEGHSVTYVARSQWSFIGIFPSHGADASWDSFQWAIDHAKVAARIAEALGCPVWSFHVEPRSDEAEATRFAPDGEARSYGGLGEMVAALGIDERTLVEDVAFAAGATYALGEPQDPARFEAYIDSLPEPGGGPIVEQGANIALYFRQEVADDLRATAERENVSAGQVLWAAWECSKKELHRTVPGCDEEATSLEPPEPSFPELPRCSPSARDLPDLELSTTKADVKVVLPDRTAAEVMALARHTDRTLSWILERAYLVGRKHIG